MENLIWLIPVLPLLGFFVLGLGAKQLPKGVAGMIGCASVLASFVLSLGLMGAVFSNGALEQNLFTWVSSGTWSVDFGFLVDPLSLIMVLVISGVGSLIHIYSTGYMHDDERHNYFFAYLNLFVFFMLILVMSNNYLLLFAGWEGVGLCSYLLIGFWFKVDEYNEAAKKAFVMNRIGDLGFLLGLFLILVNFGTLNYSGVFNTETLSQVPVSTLTAITLLFIVGAAGKSAQIPLYTWLPDAMAGPTPVSALIHAATMVTAGIYLTIRSHVLFDLSPISMQVLTVVGLATSIFAATIGLKQNDIKKVLAYSTVSQLGLMFFALGLGAYVAALFHLVTHAFFKALLFLGAGSVIHGLGGEQDIRKMGALRKVLPITFIVFLVGTLAIAGIPPFAGFVSKDQILLAAYEKSPLLFAAGVIASLLTVFYMFRMFFLVFFGQSRVEHDTLHHAHESPISMTAPLGVLAVLSVIGGFLNWPALMGGGDWLQHTLAGVLGMEEGHEHQHAISASTEWILMGIVVALVVAVIAFAYSIYVGKNTVPVEDEAEQGFGRVLSHKYFVDELYQALFVKPTQLLSEWFGRVVDPKILDGIINGVGQSVTNAGALLKNIQQGAVGLYLFVFALGIILLLALQILF
ncbi:NADH-quinone oxidoreductase subunit L [Haliscomenobacter sp.]|uniref:NADH-quinone oxidoreductase subunit L n=1 Tax=Haliscomenobacter sp. TaxID=2717303 RepID=UPI0035933E67